MFGFTRPRRRILGSTFAGVVEEAGAKAERFAPGEAVCGMTGTKLGTHAQFVVARADRVARVPEGVTLEDAVGVLFGGTTALHFLRDTASVAAGDTVLVNGASGAVGSNAVQLAKHFGAIVTAVTSDANTDLVTALGADHVVAHDGDDLAAIGTRYDKVLDCVGNLTVDVGRRLLAEDGVLVLLVASLWDNIRRRKDVVAGSAPRTRAGHRLPPRSPRQRRTHRRSRQQLRPRPHSRRLPTRRQPSQARQRHRAPVAR
ncbi:MAG: NAD(P)-dependent alcohol dehydrogenase [Acidimicrobiales bacterium]|nr:NAD(P)-dependent alcohol dehydrogenase [Acidimicrobiales bacterium]